MRFLSWNGKFESVSIGNVNNENEVIWDHLGRFGQVAHNAASLEILEDSGGSGRYTDKRCSVARVFCKKKADCRRASSRTSRYNPVLASQLREAWEEVGREISNFLSEVSSHYFEANSEPRVFPLAQHFKWQRWS